MAQLKFKKDGEWITPDLAPDKAPLVNASFSGSSFSATTTNGAMVSLGAVQQIPSAMMGVTGEGVTVIGAGAGEGSVSMALSTVNQRAAVVAPNGLTLNGASLHSVTISDVEPNMNNGDMWYEYDITEFTGLCLTANTAGSTVTLNAVGTPSWSGYYSTNNIIWREYTPSTELTLTNIGDYVYFKGVQSAAFDGSNYLSFSMTGSIAASGNCMSIWCGDSYATATAIPYVFAGYRLFNGCAGLTSSPELPATTLQGNCYREFFYGCTSLTSAPTLSATTPAAGCYRGMFQGCTSLTTAPELSATTLTTNCYVSMFQGCTSLTSVSASFTEWLDGATTNWLSGVASNGTFDGNNKVPAPSSRNASTIPADWTTTGLVYKPLTFTANTAGSRITLMKMGDPAWTGSYSTDGTTWYEYTLDTEIILDEVGDKVYFKGVQSADFSDDNYLNFNILGSVAASGNCMSLWCGDDFGSATAIPYDGSGCRLFFGCGGNLTSAPDLPAITLKDYCYLYMFYECTSLTTPPALPATSLTGYCYCYMFYNCTSLTAAPALPATTLAEDCYLMMFGGCSQLIVSDTSGTGYDKAWTIPAEGTFTNTYAQSHMFTNCAGTRSSDDMAGASGQSYTYYTQNTPV